MNSNAGNISVRRCTGILSGVAQVGIFNQKIGCGGLSFCRSNGNSTSVRIVTDNLIMEKKQNIQMYFTI